MDNILLQKTNIAVKNDSLTDERLHHAFLFLIRPRNESDSAESFEHLSKLNHLLPTTSYTFPDINYWKCIENIKSINKSKGEIDLLQKDDTCTSCEFDKSTELKRATFQDIIKQDVTPELYYLHKISNMPYVEAIITESNNDQKYFTTILSKWAIEIREKIYDVEMEMHEIYTNEEFIFSILHLENSYEIRSILKNKKVLFNKNLIYAGHAEAYIDY